MNAKQTEVYSKLLAYVNQYASRRNECQTEEDRNEFDALIMTMKKELGIAEIEIAFSNTGEIMMARFHTLLRNVNQDSLVFDKIHFIREVYNLW